MRINEIKNRLNRVKGQIEATQRMREDNRDCLEIVQQLTAAASALKKIIELILTDEICSGRIEKDKKWQEKLRKLLKTN